MRHVLALIAAARVAYCLSPPVTAWWRERVRRITGNYPRPHPPPQD